MHPGGGAAWCGAAWTGVPGACVGAWVLRVSVRVLDRRGAAPDPLACPSLCPV